MIVRIIMRQRDHSCVLRYSFFAQAAAYEPMGGRSSIGAGPRDPLLHPDGLQWVDFGLSGFGQVVAKLSHSPHRAIWRQWELSRTCHSIADSARSGESIQMLS
jgi:hypothetical protein